MAVRSYQPQQFMLFFSNPKDILGQDHLCFVVDDIVEHLDLSVLTDKQGTVGAPCYDYRLLIKVLFYGYATGTFSSRKIMKSTQENIAYIYLTRQQVPNFRTISDFRKNYHALLEDSFINIVKAAKEIGLIKLGTVTLDSTKIRANASSQKTFTQDELREQKQRIKEAISEAIKTDDAEDKLYGEDKTGDELPEDIKDQKKRLEKIKQALHKAKELNKEKINLTDQDANFMKSNSLIQTNYNCQIAVDNKTELILSGEVKTCVADAGEVKAQVEIIKQTFKTKPKELLADSGYYSVDSLTYLDDNRIKGYLPHPDYARDKKDKFKNKQRLFSKQLFRYNRVKDQYICPEGKILHKKTFNSERNRTLYQAKDCQQCPKKSLCLSGRAKLRLVTRHTREDLVIKMRNRLAAEACKKKYNQRAHAAETPFGHFKKNLGFRQFLCRGQPRVSTEFKLLCIGYNIRKIAPFISTVRDKTKFNSALRWSLN
jgi:transposase